MGLTIYDTNAEFVEFINYNTHDSLSDTNAMTTKINGLPNGYWVLVGIKTEGSYELHPPAH